MRSPLVALVVELIECGCAVRIDAIRLAWLPGPYAYHLLWPAERPLNARAERLASWIEDEVSVFLGDMKRRFKLPQTPA